MRTEKLKTSTGAEDHYIFMDASEIVGVVEANPRHYSDGGDWYGETNAEFKQRVVTGDERLVAESEAFLSQIEDQIPVSRGWRNVDDVVGAVPNVPAFLAGHPQHMRRREKRSKNNAPIAIYMDLTSSAGIGSKDVRKRGIVLLALARMLVEHRPVELWVGTSLSMRGGSATVAWKIDTAPLDLARASYHISSTAIARLFGYKTAQRQLGAGGGWPLNNYDRHCATAKQRLMAAGFHDVLYIPPIMLRDELISNPVAWLKRVMSEYVNVEEAA
jgi:hypothetical protein